MEDGDGSIKTTTVKEAHSSSVDQVDDSLSLKKNTTDVEVTITKESENDTSNLKDLSNVEVSNKVNGELEYSKKSDVENSKGISVNDANDNEVDQSVSNEETNSKQPDEVKTSRKRKNQTSIESLIEFEQDSDSDEVLESETSEFKGFKKRILAQTEKLIEFDDDTESLENADLIKKTRSKIAFSKSNKRNSEKDHSQQEYAQYLGLQPTVKFKCYRCSEKFQTMALLQGHQRVCCSMPPKTNHQQAALSPVDPNLSTNFRITRKVYLCSACGTYYENWNLFLHMRDVHKRHICLFCLGMFSVADKLAEHLMSKHSIHDSIIGSAEEFLSVFKGSCFLMCCICEKIFTERDDFYCHQCTDPIITTLNVKCTFCGVKCGHFLTCPNNAPHSTTTNPSSIKMQTTAPGNKSTTQGMTVTKYLVPVPKNVGEKWTKSKSQKAQRTKGAQSTSVDYEDDYDISDAASFCHVDIGDESETDKRNHSKNSSEKTLTNEDPEVAVQQCVQNLEQSKQLETLLEPLKIVPNDGEILDINKKANKEDSSVDDEIETQNVTKSPQRKLLSNLDVNDATEKSSEYNTLKEFEPEVNKDSENVDLKDSPALSVSEQNKDVIRNISLKNDKVDEAEEDTSIEENKTTETQSENSETGLQSHNLNKTEPKKRGKANYDIDDKKSQSYHTSDNDYSDTEIENKSTEHDSDVSHESSDGEQSIHDSDNNKYNENGEKSYSDSEDSDKLSLVVDDKAKDFTDDESSSEEKLDTNADEGNKDSNLSNTENQDDISNDKLIDDSNHRKNDNSIENIRLGTKEMLKGDNKSPEDGLQVASDDVPAMALTLEDKLDAVSGKAVIKECVRTSCTTCVYCSHAVKIAVNGKQLALHLLAEHRYTPVKNETTEDVVIKLKNSIPELEDVYFNTDSYDSSDKSLNVPHDQTYECFQCHFVTQSHKELYIHKKKMHQKTILLCVMCKSNFYSYSELLCHMCPGIYVSGDVMFRCCYCSVDQIPSAFRLMVHLRKSHHTCDICLEDPGDQQKLSTHMWKHKLHHLCYKCGLAYRNKPDITKHLFWKHGTESVLCKKCLQKKWPHVYHFCIPPTVFICEECNARFSRAVALKVHKRLHGGDSPYACNQCDRKFISKRLLSKHEGSHKPATTDSSFAIRTNGDGDINVDDKENNPNASLDDSTTTPTNKASNMDSNSTEENNKTDNNQDGKSHKKRKKDKDKKNKHIVDVYDLPPLNLSSESDGSEDEKTTVTNKTISVDTLNNTDLPVQSEKLESVKDFQDNETCHEIEDTVQPVPVVDGVWDNFHSYKAQLEKREALDSTVSSLLPNTTVGTPSDLNVLSTETNNSSTINYDTSKSQNTVNSALVDHDYCILFKEKKDTTSEITKDIPLTSENGSPAPREHSSSIDHDYCSNNNGDSAEVTTPGNDSLSIQPPSPQPPPIETLPSQKKKTKTPKKKLNKHNSSSSSDSSCDSDSSSCSCGTNCSCSSSSSNSSSSSSSDSESSSSEGRRRAAAKKEKKKEKAKSKQEEIVRIAQPAVEDDQPMEDEPIVDLLPAEPVEVPINESDLDTDETLTDEDFYDQHPQRHANQLLAEKRNQLMMLAAVAPVNNGNVSPPTIPQKPPTPPPVLPSVQKIPSPRSESPLSKSTPLKRKVKSKKRKKTQQSLKNTNKSTSSFYDNQPSTSFPVRKHLSNQSHINNTTVSSPHHPPVPQFVSDATPGSGSETDSTRISKRKRVRNKFYGYSSDEEEDNKPPGKWRRVETVSTPQQQPSGYNYQRSVTLPRPNPPAETSYDEKRSDSSGSDDDEPTKKPTAVTSNSSSSSSESDTEVKTLVDTTTEQTEKSDNLYCYCQCPYDEVSEMIACDGLDCTIEWFHFECVGIMVPPKGKWYCPDCRKRRDSM